jgi:hypothetical protein
VRKPGAGCRRYSPGLSATKSLAKNSGSGETRPASSDSDRAKGKKEKKTGKSTAGSREIPARPGRPGRGSLPHHRAARACTLPSLDSRVHTSAGAPPSKPSAPPSKPSAPTPAAPARRYKIRALRCPSHLTPLCHIPSPIHTPPAPLLLVPRRFVLSPRLSRSRDHDRQGRRARPRRHRRQDR